MCLSVPPLIAAILLVAFAAATGLAPVGGMTSLALAPAGWLGWTEDVARHVPLPAVALALPFVAMIERVQSQAIAQALAEPSTTAVLARGLSFRQMLWRHAWRLSAKPVAAVAGPIVGTLLSGSVAVELVTSWPGLGRLTVDALVSRDIYLAAGCATAAAVFLSAADPRIRPAARARRSPHHHGRRCGRVGAGGVVKTAARRCSQHGSLPRRWRRGWRRTIRRGQFDGRAYAPPTRVHVITRGGSITSPFFYAQRLVNPLERRYADDVSRPIPLRLPWWRGAACAGRCASSRCCCSAATGSAAISSAGCCTARGSRSAWRSSRRSGATLLGAAAGALAGFAGGLADALISRVAEVVLVLPALYVLARPPLGAARSSCRRRGPSASRP